MKKFFKLDFKIREIDSKNNLAKFQIEPLVEGFATTLGNSLRRVLLSSILGASIYAYRIKGLQQEFQVLPGCEENVTQITLNLQKIIISVDENVFSNEEEKIELNLKVKGPKTVLASDIELPAGVKIINLKQEILTIVEKNKELEIDFYVIQGRGFSNFQDNKELTDNNIGVITLSSNFSPVKKVSFNVQDINIGQRNVSERLLLEVQTNGVFSPSFCLSKAAQILVSHFNHFVELNNENLSDFVFKPSDEKLDNIPKKEIIDLDFSERTTNALRSEGIKYLTNLSQMKKSDLLKIKNLGSKSLKEITDKLEEEFQINLED